MRRRFGFSQAVAFAPFPGDRIFIAMGLTSVVCEWRVHRTPCVGRGLAGREAKVRPFGMERERTILRRPIRHTFHVISGTMCALKRHQATWTRAHALRHALADASATAPARRADATYSFYFSGPRSRYQLFVSQQDGPAHLKPRGKGQPLSTCRARPSHQTPLGGDTRISHALVQIN